MKISVKRCRTCKVLGVGPRAVKLWPFENFLYCKDDFQKALAWDESRPEVIRGLESIKDFDQDVARGLWRKIKKSKSPDWRGYLEECSGLAGWALEVGDRRTFVYYFARAVWAWDLSQEVGK